MKKSLIFCGCLMLLATGMTPVFSANEIEMKNTTEGINLNEADITPVKPPAYKNVTTDKYDVRLNNAGYIKDLNKRPDRKVDFQLKKPSITPYQSDMSVQ
ncbi:MAG: hypothetical protein K6E29_04830 [Cyanobacteria bacterium RUI128]|nr:hypothetical protein [Cyanobacteria bacterium RUI128]